MNISKALVVVGLFLQPFLVLNGGESNNLTLTKIQVVAIEDSQSDKQYELYIKLPEGYSENKDKTYPVIYYTDGIWHVELLSAASEYIMEDVILVGISWQKDINQELKKHGEHISRLRDYSVNKSTNPEHQAKYQFGQASNHLAFIRNDVISTIEKRYRTDPDNRSYFGYSLGGLFGAYILMAEPQTFKNYILGSPDLKGDVPYLSALGAKSALNHNDLSANVFITYGSLETELGAHAEEFISTLKHSKHENLTVQRTVIEGSHQSAFPMTGVRGITWLANLPSQGGK
ncbi:alpha/beta hydrolase [Thalassotalea sp. HSM 43]|uniref:alpha/beta hydrolase n=1 Tax=Thalassotalea sp. HSM 43 TaxID=2552945 RepID=UPI0010814971|nr:alpha/beta hydrolase-fold protein [Thalassotalea sp. HSM 43]QBY03966.1 alpha/beta hydrolase [Thalassotalea sp. HSM 43]